jgi:hypothetical protein
MNKTYLIVAIGMFAAALFADDSGGCQDGLSSELHQNYPDCQTIDLNAAKLIRRYFESGHIDSARMVISKWKNECYFSVTDEYISILFDILSGNFTENSIDSSMFFNAISYENQWGRYNKYRKIRLPIFLNSDSTFDSFFLHISDSLIAATDSTSLPHIFALLISGKFDKFYYLVRHEPAFRKSKIKLYYDKTVRDIQRPDPIELLGLFTYPPCPGFGGIVGVWVPTGNLSKVGQHPELGFSLGRKFWNFTGEFFLTYRFIDSKSSYFVGYKDSAYSTNSFSGPHVGVDVGYTLLKKRSWQIDALFNGGVESFSGLKKNETADIPDKSLTSYFYGPGFGWRFFIGKNRKLVLNPQLWYSFLNYGKSNTGGSNMDGGAITFRFVVHNSIYHEDDKLTRLRYFGK